MIQDNRLPVRYPKGAFAMASVYSFTGASILASIIFSLLLFLSIDDDPVMQLLFGGLAVIFELGKFFAWYEFGERRARRNIAGSLAALGFYAVLALISVGGSIGGINSATNQAQGHVNVQQSKINALNRQIDAIEQQITLNNVAAEKYIEMERIATGVARIQQENAKLRQEQQALAIERDSLPVVSQGSVLGLIDSLAQSLNVPTQTAQLWLVVFISVLLDFFAAFFVGLIGEELRFRNQFRDLYRRNESPVIIDAMPPQLDPELLPAQPASVEPQPEPSAQPTSAETTPGPEPELSVFERAVQVLEAGRVNCSKRAVAAHLKLSSEDVDQLFGELKAQGLISQKPNKHYQWHGVPAEPEVSAEATAEQAAA